MITEYDPQTCQTAGELRAMGIEIPAKIPDCAWVPRGSLITTIGGDHNITQDSVSFSYVVQFAHPFRWVEAKITAHPKDPLHG